jgi:hypothetical protein
VGGQYHRTRGVSIAGISRAVGVNYNQVVKELHSHFSEKKTLALLFKLESITKELVALSEQIVRLSQEFQTKFLNPDGQ